MPQRDRTHLPDRSAAAPRSRATRRRLALAAAALAVVAAVSTFLLPHPPPGAGSEADGARPPPTVTPAIVATPPGAPDPAAAPEPAPLPAPAPARPAGPPPPIRRPVHRLPRGSPAPVELFSGLRALGPDVSSRCADDPAAPAPRARAGTVSFLLDFESGNGNVQIVEAEVVRRGKATESFLTCARAALLGNQLRVAVARAGTHFQLPIELNP